MATIRYLYSGDREAVDVLGKRFFFRDLYELEEELFLAGYGGREIGLIVGDVQRARECGWGFSFDEPTPRGHDVGSEAAPRASFSSPWWPWLAFVGAALVWILWRAVS